MLRRCAAVLLLLCTAAFGRDSLKTNSLGYVPYKDNPNVYLFAAPIEGRVLTDGKSFVTSMRFQPFHTYQLFDQTVNFCGDVSQTFNEAPEGPLVVTYLKAAHKTVTGLACHELVGVYSVLPPKGL